MAVLGRLLALATDAPPPSPPKPRRRRGRPPIHLSASLNLVLPSQLFPECPGAGRVPGERRLALAVLEDAIGILVKHRHASEPRARLLYHETAAWIRSDATEWPFVRPARARALPPALSTARAGRLLARAPAPCTAARHRRHLRVAAHRSPRHASRMPARVSSPQPLHEEKGS